MKYKLSVKKKSGFEYVFNGDTGNLEINGVSVVPPSHESIVDYDIVGESAALGIRRCYRDDLGEVVCELVKYVDNPRVYARGEGYRNGVKCVYFSPWDLKQLMSAEEVVIGNVKTEEGGMEDV